MDKIRVIQVGAGRFGQSWMKVLCEYEQVELAAVVDVVPDNLATAKSITNLPDSRLFSSLESAVQAVQADMALIVTPPQTHKKIAMDALRLGLHVVLEKPLTHTFDEAVELYEESKKYDKHVMISQNYRWRPCIQTLKRLLKEEVVGRVGYIEYDFRKVINVGGWRNEMHEILLEDMSLHHFDIMRYVLGKEPVEVYAQSFKPHWSWFNGNPTAGAMIQFEDDIRVNYFGSWVNRGRETTWNGNIRVCGDLGAIEMIDDEILIWKEGEGTEPASVELDEAQYGDRMSSLHNFVQSIRTNTAPLTTITDNIRSFALTCGAIQSTEQQQKVKLDDFYKENGALW
ncbi:Gfo/Idh/MocA family protein [Paenibacillus radicis (ex Xue et al. 2023)]|uniref:Gfo/Idh/MocA family oxidoreductase n=1 Tax=Paenibacillus radicis (ex Xue et al. 2023) TaxID=2972489 RepID=A0ABT1YH49_9BACL|nr:Gfo/Idh/MocA family oxidoreductase [Paenibacillus radicis (ex Xue et al. 2023)]MCR8632292.1 Gfo/Idh/MocA family oxidoreductase [Paenibacillus radicis (ex Xue et al. 2023)]